MASIARVGQPGRFSDADREAESEENSLVGLERRLAPREVFSSGSRLPVSLFRDSRRFGR